MVVARSRLALLSAVLSLLVALPLHAADADAPSRATARPNFVIIVADDLGLECVQAYGGLSYQTPHIDALAAGVRFNYCFSNPYCSPSRAQLLTGRYPLHNGITRVIYEPAQHREFLDPAKETSFANLLRDAGYHTAIAGKWQVSFLHERDTVHALGFDEYQLWQLFVDGKKTSRYADPTMRQNGKVLQSQLRGRYGPDANLEFLIDFMKRHRDGPFLVYYTALLPHFPWEPTPDSGVALKPATGEGHPKYMPDMVAYLDKQVGKLVATLEELGIRDNTVVLFTGDNGTDRRITSRWTDGAVTRKVPGGKGTMTDAGTRVPLIVSWPAAIATRRTSDALVDFSDLLPMLVELAGAKPSPHPINGVSFAGELRAAGAAGSSDGPRRTWVHVQNQNERYVRNREYILTSKGALRPVAGIGEKPAKPIDSLDASQQAAREALKAGLQAAKDLSQPQ